MTFPDALTAFGVRYVPEPAAQPVTPQLYRVKHDAELPAGIWRTGVPEVFRLSPWHGIPLNRAWQEFTFQLNQPGLTGEKWRVLYDYRRAFTNNGAGYDYPSRTEEKADWINTRDTGARDLPRFDGPRICGGAVVTGRVEGSLFWLHYLDANGPPPAVADVKPWEKFCATTVTANGIGRFPQRGGMDVWVPLIARQPVYLPLANLQRWDAEELPDAYTLYL
jgi:hypothetical protein